MIKNMILCKNPTSPKKGDIIIRLKHHPKEQAKAVVSRCSAELSILKSKMVNSLKVEGGTFLRQAQDNQNPLNKTAS